MKPKAESGVCSDVAETLVNMVLLPALEALLSSISIGPLDLDGLTLTPIWVGADGPMGDFLSVYVRVENVKN